MTISVVIPACDAQPTLVRALSGLFQQTEDDWEAIILSDDGTDYERFLASQGIRDVRLRFASTGQIRSGAHNARNVGFRFVTGTQVTHLDADDAIDPSRFAALLPLTERYGAAVDNTRLVDDLTGVEMFWAMGLLAQGIVLDTSAFMKVNYPMFPMVHRDHLITRTQGVEFSEDFIANLQLIDRIGLLPVMATPSYSYRVRKGSMSNSDGSAIQFDKAYNAFIDRLENGDGFGLQAANRAIALDGVARKRALNRAYLAALATEPGLTFAKFSIRVTDF